MKRKLIIIGLLLLGVVTSSYNSERTRIKIKRLASPEIDKSLDGLNSSLDSLNKAFHEIE